MKVLYFDCFSGISGDMTIGALLDLGIDTKEFLRQLHKIKADGYTIEIKKKQVNGIAATDFGVIVDAEQASHHHHRCLHDIKKLIDESELSSEVKDLSKRIFEQVGAAEARVNGKPVEEIHFHEVEAIDSIVDIVGTAICTSMLGADKIYASPLPLGTGFAECTHGMIPVPAPATVEILKDVPVYSTGIKGELVTPTGAAIIKSLVDKFLNLPHIELERVGYGSGKKQYAKPNVLRVFLGAERDDAPATNRLMMLETNIDDMNPEVYSYSYSAFIQSGSPRCISHQYYHEKGKTRRHAQRSLQRGAKTRA